MVKIGLIAMQLRKYWMPNMKRKISMKLSEVKKQLTQTQKNGILKVLLERESLFDGTVGVYPHKQFHIELIEGAVTKHQRAYPVPKIHLETFRKELNRLVDLGVLGPQGLSQWSRPSFINAKKDGRVRWISDLRELDKCCLLYTSPSPRDRG